MNILEKIGITTWKGIHGDGVDRRGNKHIISETESIAIIKKSKNDVLYCRLISQAPALLEALIGHVYTYYQCYMEGDIGFDCIEDDIGILESATGKTWPELKAMMEEV